MVCGFASVMCAISLDSESEYCLNSVWHVYTYVTEVCDRQGIRYVVTRHQTEDNIGELDGTSYIKGAAHIERNNTGQT